jgi:hypothetical protein
MTGKAKKTSQDETGADLKERKRGDASQIRIDQPQT